MYEKFIFTEYISREVMDMQKKVQIVSDGSLDLSQEITKEHDIEVVPFYVSFYSETYQKEMVEL